MKMEVECYTSKYWLHIQNVWEIILIKFSKQHEPYTERERRIDRTEKPVYRLRFDIYVYNVYTFIFLSYLLHFTTHQFTFIFINLNGTHCSDISLPKPYWSWGNISLTSSPNGLVFPRLRASHYLVPIDPKEKNGDKFSGLLVKSVSRYIYIICLKMALAIFCTRRASG